MDSPAPAIAISCLWSVAFPLARRITSRSLLPHRIRDSSRNSPCGISIRDSSRLPQSLKTNRHIWQRYINLWNSVEWCRRELLRVARCRRDPWHMSDPSIPFAERDWHSWQCETKWESGILSFLRLSYISFCLSIRDVPVDGEKPIYKIDIYALRYHTSRTNDYCPNNKIFLAKHNWAYSNPLWPTFLRGRI